ncbi:hypothetical protein, partial [Bartonella sp. AC70YNML]|uniref:hypothetical protein n=1 Tax=Bartonella sp. AC70YNML TaxID=3243460 RepID=UPI0035D09C3A
LKNEADSTPVITEKTEYSDISFQKPDKYNFLDGRPLYHDMDWDRWGKGKLSKRKHGAVGPKHFIFEQQLWNNKEGTYGTATLKDGTAYKAFTWKHNARKGDIEEFVWNGDRWGVLSSNENWSHMTEKTVTQGFSHKPVSGMIQSSGNLIINADTIDNHYSTIEVGG